MARVRPKYEHDPLCSSHMGGACDCYVSQLGDSPKTIGDLRRMRNEYSNKEKNMPKKPTSVYERESIATRWFVGIIIALALLAIGLLVFSAGGA